MAVPCNLKARMIKRTDAKDSICWVLLNDQAIGQIAMRSVKVQTGSADKRKHEMRTVACWRVLNSVEWVPCSKGTQATLNDAERELLLNWAYHS